MRSATILFALLSALGITASIAAPSPPSHDINLAAFANGALRESVSSEYGGGWEARWITDEDPKTGWAAAKGAAGPFNIVISLPEHSEIHALEFDNASVDGDGGTRGAKDIDVMVSDTSATAGFTLLTSVVLKLGKDKQHFNLATPGACRWIKLVFKSNNGDQEYTELMEFRAFGTQLTQTPLPTNLSGTYSSDNYGNFHLQQDGAQLVGCYEHSEGLVQGGLESHLMRLTWYQSGGIHGSVVMVLKRNGKGFEGWWNEVGSSGDDAWKANWDVKKISDKVGSCPHWNPKAASGNIVATQLAAEGHVRIYGINFDVDSDHLRADAKPAVDELLGALKANPTWHVSIEGHTDATGGAAHNLDLSQRRAAAVKATLVAAEIAADRMTTEGYGQTKPVMSNDTGIGRSQNRRVEVVRK